jgi:hypothetical protein
MTFRCERCNVPHATNEESNKTGGHGYIYQWESGLCPVCRQYKTEKREQAKPFLKAQKLKRNQKDATLDQYQ